MCCLVRYFCAGVAEKESQNSKAANILSLLSKSLKYISTGSYQPYQGSILNFSMEINVLLNDVQAISYYSSISF